MPQHTASFRHFALERMTPFQWRAVAVCVLLTMLDGST